MPAYSLVRSTTALKAQWLFAAAVVLLAALPVAMVIANRSSIAFLVASTLCALGGIAVERRMAELVRDLGATLTRPLGLATLAFLGWSVLSLFWSEARTTSLHFVGEFWLPCTAALILGFTLPQRLSRTGLWVIAGTLLLGCLIILVELALGLDHRLAFGARAVETIFNRPAVTILTLAIPVLAGLLDRRRAAWRFSAVALFAAVAVVAATTESGAAALGLLVAVVVLAVARLARRFAMAGGAIAVVLVLASAPLLGPLAETTVPGSVHQVLSGAHTRERVAIWSAFAAVVREEPVIGTGFATSARMPSLSVAARVEPRYVPDLSMNHPHNAALQVWVELGAVGAALATLVLLLTLGGIARLQKRPFLVALPLFATVAAISLVSHGAWQGWWAAVVGAAVVLARAVESLARDEADFAMGTGQS